MAKNYLVKSPINLFDFQPSSYQTTADTDKLRKGRKMSRLILLSFFLFFGSSSSSDDVEMTDSSDCFTIDRKDKGSVSSLLEVRY